MNGLTSRQDWTHEHIARCTCGSWFVITEWQRLQLAVGNHPTCTHINHTAMEAS